MVSWLRSFEINWKHLESVFDPADAINLQLAFQEIRQSPNPRGSFWAWVKEAENMPGAILLPKGDTKKGTQGGRVVPNSKVTTIHHLQPLAPGEEGDRFVCLDSLKVLATTVNVSVDELFSSLVSEIKASTKNVRERNIPPLGKFLELKTENIRTNYQAEPGEACLKADLLVDWPCGVYVPFPLLHMIFNDASIPEGEHQPCDLDDPTEMFERLLDGMGDLAHEDPGAFQEWKGSAMRVGLFLWAIANEFNQGVATTEALGSRAEVMFTLKCNQEILLTESEVKRKVDALFKGSAPDYPQAGLEREQDRDVASKDSSEEERTLDDKKRGPEVVREDQADEAPELQQGDTKRARANAATLPPPPEPMNLAGGGGGGANGGGEERESLLVLRDILRGMATSNREFLAEMTESNKLIAASNQASTRALLAQGAALKELTLASKESIDAKEAKKKATSNWLPADVFLLKVLSAEQGWHTVGVPTTTIFADSLFDKKNIIKATNLVRETGVKEQWCGGILKSGLTEFIGGGFVVGDIDEGPASFSVLYCFASSYTETDSTDFRKQQVKDAFGESKGLTDEMVAAFEKQHIFVPDDTYKALEQLEVAIALLKAVCGRDTIAVDGYEEGHKILKNNKKKFDDWAKSDSQFLLKYLLFLDRIFYLFCKELQEFESSPNPLLDAQPDLQTWLVRNVQRGVLQYLRIGVKPEFGVPRSLQGRTATKEGLLDLKSATATKNKQRGAGSGAGAAVAGPGGGGSGAGEAGGTAPPAWQKTMPAGEYVPEWQIPTGKRFGDFFGPHLIENNKIFPRFAHHKTRRPSSMCARYQIELARGCKFGADCSLTHVRPKDIPTAVREKITVDLKALFTTGGGART